VSTLPVHVDPTHPHYDWRIAAANARQPVYLADGREAVLVSWQRHTERAKVCVGGRHQWVDKADVVWPSSLPHPHETIESPQPEGTPA
jgi:hypothetical protein